MTIFAVNRHQEDALSFECELRGLKDYSIIEHIVLENQEIKAANTADNPDNVVPHKNGNSVIEDERLKAIFPKLSWNVVRLSKE